MMTLHFHLILCNYSKVQEKENQVSPWLVLLLMVALQLLSKHTYTWIWSILQSQECGQLWPEHIKSFHLDVFKSIDDLDMFLKVIFMHSVYNYKATIVLFPSLESLLKPSSLSFAKVIIAMNLFIILFCIDEIDWFNEFGISLRYKFQHIKNRVIKLLRNKDGTLKELILMITTTFGITLYCLLQNIVGLTITLQKKSWGNASHYQKATLKVKWKTQSNILQLYYKRYTCHMCQ